MLGLVATLALSRRDHRHHAKSSAALVTEPAPKVVEACSTEAAKKAAFPSCSISNYKCKNATSNWPKCTPPAEGLKLRFGSGNNLPIGGWWPPPTDGKPEDAAELNAYASANFSMVMIGDREPENCSRPEHWKETWQMLLKQLDVVESYNMQALIDGYICSSWGGPNNLGTAQPFFSGEEDGPPGAWVDHAYLHKPSPRESKWIVEQLKHRESVAAVLLADDAQDLEGSELASMQTIREHAPQIFPWVNQIMDPSDTAWLARGGFPYIMPELYSVEGVGHISDQGQNLLKDLETWGRMGERFQQKLWPLLNLPSQGVSPAKVRFQAYAALAYGSKGLFWFCWRSGGGWDHKADSPGTTMAYPALKAVNTRARAWAEPILSHPRFEGAYHTQSVGGWSGPETSTHTPSEKGIVTVMSDDLFVSVLAGETTEDSLLLVLVDKEVREDDKKIRDVALHLNPSLISKVRMIGVDDGSDNLNAVWSGAKRGKWVDLADLKSARLGGKLAQGGAALIEIKAHDLAGQTKLHEAASDMRRWRHPAKTPNLDRVRIKHHEKYNQRFSTRVGPKLQTMIAASGSASSGNDLAEAGFNAMIDTAKHEAEFHVRLNEGLREGMVVFAQVDHEEEDATRATQRVMNNHACHPYFGGVHLLSNVDREEEAKLAPGAKPIMKLAAKHVNHAASASAAVRKTGPGEFFALGTAPTLLDRNELHAHDVPYVMVKLSEPFSESTLNRLAVAWQRAPAEDYAEADPMLFRLTPPPLAGHDDSGTPLHVQVEGCEKSAKDVQASSRFAAFAAVAFGAKGIVHTGIGQPDCTDISVARSIYANAITQWTARQLLTKKATQVFSSMPFDLAGAHKANNSRGHIVQNMDDRLLVSVFESSSRSSKWHSRREGVQTISKAPPPMLLVVDGREEGDVRTTHLELDSQVYSATPMVGDRQAGFEECRQADLGSTVRVHLAPGEGVLLMLNMYATEEQWNTIDQMQKLQREATLLYGPAAEPQHPKKRAHHGAAYERHRRRRVPQ